MSNRLMSYRLPGLAQAVAVAGLAVAATPVFAQDTAGVAGKTSPAGPAANAANGIAAPRQPIWDSFHGQLSAQKYSPLTQITADNVDELEKVWSIHTGDLSDGSGDVPATVWSSTPVFADNTLYVGTPFGRLFAIDPGTGEKKWVFDTHAPKKALTQPVLKNRGVAYWQAADHPHPCPAA